MLFQRNTIFIAAAISIMVIGCRKEWVCTCSTSEGAVDIIIKKAKKKQAEEVCMTRAEEPILNANVSRCVLDGKYKKGKN